MDTVKILWSIDQLTKAVSNKTNCHFSCYMKGDNILSLAIFLRKMRALGALTDILNITSMISME